MQSHLKGLHLWKFNNSLIFYLTSLWKADTVLIYLLFSGLRLNLNFHLYTVKLSIFLYYLQHRI